MIGKTAGAHGVQSEAVAEELMYERALVLDNAALLENKTGEKQIGDQQYGG